MPRKCLILGASGGIGKAIVRSVVNDGYCVGLQYNRDHKSIDSLQNEIPDLQLEGFFQADLSTSMGIMKLTEEAGEDWDAIIFTGGQMYRGLFQEMSMEKMDELYHVHVKALWMITKQVLPSMIRKKAGNIIVISSIFGLEGASLEVLYSSVKGAQISFVKGLAKEVAPSGIRVNSVAPGLIETKMNDRLSEEEWMVLEDEIPMGRAGRPEEVADTVSYLLNEKSSYMTGQILQLNGGWS